MPLSFPYNAYALALLAGFSSTLLSLPLWRAWCRRVGLLDQPGHRKIHADAVPLAGGFAVLTGLLVPLVGGWCVLQSGILPDATTTLFSHGFEKRGLQIAAIALGALCLVVLGWLDDKHELKAAPKFGGQVLVALLVAGAGVRITLFVPNPLVNYLFTVGWILTVITAVNIFDNMNGLCAGVGAICAAGFAAVGAMHGHYLVASLGLLIAGALLGFLPFNYPRASAFLGDSGSHLVGYLLAVVAILPHFYSSANPRPIAVAAPLIMLSVPLIDLVIVVLIRYRLGVPIWVGDNNHLSHRLVRRGWSKPKAVALIWAMTAGSVLMGIWLAR